MLKRNILIAIITIFFSIQDLHAQSYFTNEYLNVWNRSTAYSLEVAKLMPDSMYQYKPTKQSLSFKEQQLHTVENISFLTQYATGVSKIFYDENSIDDLNKKEIIEILTAAFIYVNKLIVDSDFANLSEKVVFKGVEMSKENIFYLIRNHLSHHRAQSVLYLRLNGIAPPPYVGW